jgi:hypothetical protein
VTVLCVLETSACSSSNSAANSEPKGPYEEATVLATGLDLPTRLNRDANAVFFLARQGGIDDAIYTLPDQGGTPVVLTTPAAALAAFEGQLYFEGADGIDIMAESGGSPTLVADSLASAVDIHVADIAVDSSGMYFAREDSEGGGQVLLFASGDTEPTKVSPLAAAPDHMALDADNVYWVAGGVVHKAPKTGGQDEWLATFNAESDGIAVDEGYVYWTSLDNYGSVRRVAKQGGDTQILVQGINHPRSVAVDATHVYFSAEGAGKIERVPKAGGAVERMAIDQDGPSSLALSDDRVFWANRNDGTIASVSK